MLLCAAPMNSEHSAPPFETPSHPLQRPVLAVVFSTILIDFIGFSVLIPVLPLYAERFGATPFQVGLFLTVYALAQLLFLPVWGWVSDRVGRRPVLLVSLCGTVASFVVLALANSIGIIYVARAFSGFFAASIGTAQAVVIDVTPPSQRARGMGVIGAAFGAGMIVGPMIGGVLARFGEKVPFYGIAALAALNFIVAWWRLPESRPAELRPSGWRDLGRSLVPTPVRLFMAVHERRIGLYLYLFFHMFTAFAVVESMITLFLGKRFGADMFDAGLFFAWVGLFLVITQSVLLRRLVDDLGEVRLVGIGLVVMAVGLAAVAVAPAFHWFYLVGPVIAFGNGITFPSFTSLFSKACEAEQAGELLGQSQSMATTGRVVGSAVAGFIMERWGLGVPFLLAGAMMLVSLFIFWMGHRILVEGRDGGGK